MVYDCIIIGAGPAGLMAGCFLDGMKTLILEGEAKAAQKLLLSGSGQCNFTHGGSIRDFFEKYGAHGRFVRKALSAFDNAAVMDFFKSRGVEVFVRADEKVFPKSLDAWDIFRALREGCAEGGAEIRTDAKVTRLTVAKDGFVVHGKHESWKAKTVIIAAGGASYPMTGSDGSGIEIARGLGHAIESLHPALTPAYMENFPLTPLAGTTYIGGRLHHYRDSKKLGSYRGDILVTHTGLSGPCILDNSRAFRSGDQVELCMLGPGESRKSLEDKLLSGNRKLVRTVLSESMTRKNADLLVDLAPEVTKDTICAELGKGSRKWLLSHAEGFRMTIRTLGSMKSAMATAGGVALKGVSQSTMESKVVEGLYFAGEVLDVDGDSGGYNIQWAFSSGRMAADSIRKRLRG